MDTIEAPLPPSGEDGTSARDILGPLAARWRLLGGITVLAGALALAGTYLIAPRFTATATFIPPTQQSSAAAALSSLGAIAGLGGQQTSTADQLVGLLGSTSIADRLVDEFKLMPLYDVKYRFLAREKLAKRTVISVGKKSGLVSISVDDTDAVRAAAMANAYIADLRQLASTLSVSEAQRRRVFFERQLQSTRANLAAAQSAMQDSGISAGALKAVPATAGEAYARLRAELTTTEVSLQTLRQSLADSSPQIRQLLARQQALREQIATMERPDAAAPAGSAASSASADYISKFREFKYQETLLEMLSKQYELARVDEARDGDLIQVVDVAHVPEYKSSPKRLPIAVAVAAAALLLACMWLVWRHRGSTGQPTPDNA